MNRNEAQTRKELIDKKIEYAKWEKSNKDGIVEAGKVCTEIEIDGIKTSSSGKGYIDYVFFDDNRMPLAISEAKKEGVSEEQGRIQAHDYADAIEKKYGIRPLIYLTNGHSTKIIDGIRPAREIFGFHKKDEMRWLIQKRKYANTKFDINENICNRYYQKQAITAAIERFDNGHRGALLSMVMSSGKTRVACAIADILIKTNRAKRILFIADRINLAKQAKDKTFSKFILNEPMAVLAEGKVDGDIDSPFIFATDDAIMNYIKDVKNSKFGIGHFDYIIVDEAHRSIFDKNSYIFDYFDAQLLGLTATPRKDEEKSSYEIFTDGIIEPTYEYTEIRGVKDKYLNYYRALDRTPDILKYGIHYKDLSPDEKKQYEEKFTNDDGNLPEWIAGANFGREILNKDTIRKILTMLMDEGLKVDFGNTLGKTIIFCQNKQQAELVQKIFFEMYPEKHIAGLPHGADYCVVIHSNIKHNDELQREFMYGDNIRIAISVDMLDTGFDVEDVLNLVFFKKVKSQIRFKQMIGRALRLCNKTLNVFSPSREYFERKTDDATRKWYKEKQGALIFDVCDVFANFLDEKDYDKQKTTSTSQMSLNQQLFYTKALLLKAMQEKYVELSIEDRELCKKIKSKLVEETRSMNRNQLGVQISLKYIERYSDENAWTGLTHDNMLEIKKHIAINASGTQGEELEKLFDCLAYKFSTRKLLNDKHFEKTAKSIYRIGKELSKCLDNTEVEKQEKEIIYLTTSDFFDNATPSTVEQLREKLRGLMKYLNHKSKEMLESDFIDQISSTEEIKEKNIDFNITVDDYKTNEEKVQFYLQFNLNEGLIRKIRNMLPYDAIDIDITKNNLKKLFKPSTQYNEMFPSDKDLIHYIRKSVKFSSIAREEFVLIYQSEGMTKTQANIVETILKSIEQNGYLNKKDPQILNLQLSKYFTNQEKDKLFADLNEFL